MRKGNVSSSTKEEGGSVNSLRYWQRIGFAPIPDKKRDEELARKTAELFGEPEEKTNAS